jgi:hypothetical protein
MDSISCHNLFEDFTYEMATGNSRNLAYMNRYIHEKRTSYGY